jgi:hypothetical protein
VIGIRTAEQYRKQAEDCRRNADCTHASGNKSRWLAVAEGWEFLARSKDRPHARMAEPAGRPRASDPHTPRSNGRSQAADGRRRPAKGQVVDESSTDLAEISPATFSPKVMNANAQYSSPVRVRTGLKGWGVCV